MLAYYALWVWSVRPYSNSFFETGFGVVTAASGEAEVTTKPDPKDGRVRQSPPRHSADLGGRQQWTPLPQAQNCQARHARPMKGLKRKGGLQGGGKALTAIEMLKEAPKPVKKVLRPEDTILGVTLS